MTDDASLPLFLAVIGLGGGIVLFARGLVAYRRDRLISSVATSSLDAIAAGEVRVSGIVEALEQTLVSPLQSRPCVWYRAKVETTGENSSTLLDEERAVHFRIRDGQGHIRVVPRGARWEIDASFDEATSITGSEPPALDRRPGAAFAIAADALTADDPAQMTEAQRQAAIETLLTVKPPERSSGPASQGIGSGLFGKGSETTSGRRYREARLEPGQTVTVIGQALPWADVAAQSDVGSRSSAIDRDIAQDIAAARASGVLVGSPEEAWGNAAIPGFGIGRPIERPELDPDARAPQLADPATYEESMEPYTIPADSLVLAKAPGGSMAVYLGAPAAATRQHDTTFLLGLVGAVMAVVSALGLGALLAGSL
jgi:hypothetical protein